MSNSNNNNNKQMSPEVEAAWKLVVSYLHWGGEHESKFSTAQQRQVRLLADGFGRQPAMEDPNLLWDWSHVRDSSPEAILRMAVKIQEMVR